MCSLPTVLLFAPSGGPVAQDTLRLWESELGRNGLAYELFHQAAQLYARLSPEAPPVLVLLAGHPAQNAMVSAYVCRRCPQLPVACVADSRHESELAMMLDAGASIYLPPTAGSVLLLATVRRFLAVATGGGAQRQASVASAVWRLIESQSVLVAPSGERIALTGVERRVLRLLLAGPPEGLSHDALLQALNRSLSPDASQGSSFGRTRLSVMFSRLRRKCARHGLVLPLASVHGWGYQFTGYDPEP